MDETKAGVLWQDTTLHEGFSLLLKNRKTK